MAFPVFLIVGKNGPFDPFIIQLFFPIFVPGMHPVSSIVKPEVLGPQLPSWNDVQVIEISTKPENHTNEDIWVLLESESFNFLARSA